MGPLAEAGLAIGVNAANAGGNLIFGEIQQRRQLEGQKKALAQQNAAAYDMWLKTNYSAQRHQLEKAGLNPGLLYGMGGGGGGQTGSSSAMPSAQNVGQMDIASAAQLALLKAQKENIEADTANKKADAGKKGAETPGAQADSEMKGQERDSRKGWTSVMSKTFGDEQEARQAIASTINEMWVEGKLKEGAEADLQSKLLANAKSEAERNAINKGIEKMKVDIKTGELNNEILELEKDLQKELGIDKNSPTFLKVVGRLILKYFK